MTNATLHFVRIPVLSLLGVLLVFLAGCRAGSPDASPVDAALVLEGRLFDSTSGQVIEDGVVVVAGDTVACSGARAACAWPADTPVRRFESGTILPGLIDLHVHARPHYVGAFLPAGVTAVRDANNTLAIARQLRAGEGPRLFASGPLLDAPGSVIGRMSQTDGRLGEHPLEQIMPIYVEDPEDAAAAVEALAAAGVDLVKLYATLEPEAFTAAVHTARRHDLPVAADLGMLFTQALQGAQVDIVEAAEAGVASVEHLSGLSLAYHRLGGDPMDETLDAAVLDSIAAALARADAAVVPTLANLTQFAEPGALSAEGLPGAERLAPYFEGHWQGLLGWAERDRARFAAARRLKVALLDRLKAQGVSIGAGSDLPAAPYMLPGLALHQELEALVAAGLTPVEALQAATATAAAILDRSDLGHLRTGAKADIVVVDGDPTVSIRDSRRIRAVWKGGEAVDIERAWRAVEAQMRQISETDR